MADNKLVALAFPVGETHLERAQRGIRAYAQQHGPWTLVRNPEAPMLSVESLEDWHGDGVIAYLDTEEEIEAARRLRVPVVGLAGVVQKCPFPRVMVDHEAVGRLAAEHLLECCFQRFAYYGVSDAWYSKLREKAFCARVKEAGYDCSVLEVLSGLAAPKAWLNWREPLEEWLRSLETPLGLMAVHDFRAQMASEAARGIGRRVPEDVAIVGVNDDLLVCELAIPMLSSVLRNAEEVGRQAAALLDRLMAGEPAPKQDVLVLPDGVKRRRSTDVIASDYPYITDVVRYIRENLEKPLETRDLVKVVPVSRRWLEHRFKQCVGRTLQEYICEARVERAKELLVRPEKMHLYKIASACGFTGTENLRNVFKRVTGTMPAQYRRQMP